MTFPDESDKYNKSNENENFDEETLDEETDN